MKQNFATRATIFSLCIFAFAMYAILNAATAQALTSTELTTNGTFEQAGATATTALGWQPFNNGYTRTSAGAHSGSWGISLTNTNTSTLSGAYERIDLNQTKVEPVFIGGYVKGSNISMASGSYYGASIYAEIHFTDGTVAYWNSIPNEGTFNWRWVGFNTGSGFTVTNETIPVTKPIAYIFVVPMLGDASGTAYFDVYYSSAVFSYSACSYSHV